MPAPYGQSQGGYDSSGINPHGGMYTGGQMRQQSTFPQNPGGFQPMGGQFPPQPMTGGPLQAQSGYPMLGSQLQPQGLAAMLRGYSPYRFG